MSDEDPPPLKRSGWRLALKIFLGLIGVLILLFLTLVGLLWFICSKH